MPTTRAAARNSGWQPPDLAARQEALGAFPPNNDNDDDDPTLRLACCMDETTSSIRVFFRPKRLHENEDWLADGSPGEEERDGQSYQDYIEEQLIFPTQDKRTIYLCNIDDVADNNEETSPAASPMQATMELMRQFVQTYFCTPCKLLSPLTPDERAELRGRQKPLRQLRTGHILDVLFERKCDLEDAFAVMGVTMEDLYPGPTWNFVFGMADMTNCIGIFSFCRYDPTFETCWLEEVETKTKKRRKIEQPVVPWPSLPGASNDKNLSLFTRRAVSTLAHEIGHIYGLAHCVYYQCLMNGANHLDEKDESPLMLCPICLRKLHYAMRKAKSPFDCSERYMSLQLLTAKINLKRESQWYAAAAKRCQLVEK